MTTKNPRFAIFGNAFQDKVPASASAVISVLHENGADVAVEKSFYNFLSRQGAINGNGIGVFERPEFEADYAVSIGGDGTFLRTATTVGIKQTPIIGVNTGRLGFLAGILPKDIEKAFADILSHNYIIEKHSAIQIEAEGAKLKGCPYALNDIAVLKRDIASMISIHASVNGEYVVTYQADGLIVSTPTGSTAYSLSNGGPIIVPQSGTLCLTPVAPHSLNIRPIIISDNSTVTLEVESRSHNFLAAIDGRSETLADNVAVNISRAPFATNIVKLPGMNYFQSLREKMMWGADKRRG